MKVWIIMYDVADGAGGIVGVFRQQGRARKVLKSFNDSAESFTEYYIAEMEVE